MPVAFRFQKRGLPPGSRVFWSPFTDRELYARPTCRSGGAWPAGSAVRQPHCPQGTILHRPRMCSAQAPSSWRLGFMVAVPPPGSPVGVSSRHREGSTLVETSGCWSLLIPRRRAESCPWGTTPRRSRTTMAEVSLPGATRRAATQSRCKATLRSQAITAARAALPRSCPQAVQAAFAGRPW